VLLKPSASRIKAFLEILPDTDGVGCVLPQMLMVWHAITGSAREGGRIDNRLRLEKHFIAFLPDIQMISAAQAKYNYGRLTGGSRTMGRLIGKPTIV
jgi:hypothetical protein